MNCTKLSVAEIIANVLVRFDALGAFEQENLTKYFACPNLPDCEFDKLKNPNLRETVCARCKSEWLSNEWRPRDELFKENP